MNQQRRLEVALRKQTLLLASASQRQQLAQHAQGLQPVFAAGDRGLEIAAWVREHVAVITAVGVAALAVRPRSLWRLGMRGFYFWRMYKTLRSRF